VRESVIDELEFEHQQLFSHIASTENTNKYSNIFDEIGFAIVVVVEEEIQ
jgi:hypothetical protein